MKGYSQRSNAEFRDAVENSHESRRLSGFRSSTPLTHSYMNGIPVVVPSSRQLAGSLNSTPNYVISPPPTSLSLLNTSLNGIRKKPVNTASSKSITESSSSLGLVRDKRQLPAPPKHNVMFHPSRYKTEICRQFEELGTCEYKDRCLFAHGKYELRPMPNRHPKHRTELCSAFNETGYCSFGPRCSFVHVKPNVDDLIKKMVKETPTVPMPENPNFQGKTDTGAKAPLVDVTNVDAVVHELEKAYVQADEMIQRDSRRLQVFVKICTGSR